LSLALETGDVRGAAIVRSNIAMAHLELDEDDQAEDLLSEALEGFRAVRDTYGIGRTLEQRAMIALRRRDTESAIVDLREGLSLSSSIGDTQTVVHTLAVVVAAVFARGDPYTAVMLGGADDAIRMAHRLDLSPLERKMVDESTEASRRALGGDFDEAWKAGAELGAAAAVELALTALVKRLE
jgi:hypothetical protein